MARRKKQSIPGCDLFMCAAAVKYRGLLLLVILMSYHKCAATGHILPLCSNLCCALMQRLYSAAKLPQLGLKAGGWGTFWVRCSGESDVSLWSLLCRRQVPEVLRAELRSMKGPDREKKRLLLS